MDWNVKTRSDWGPAAALLLLLLRNMSHSSLCSVGVWTSWLAAQAKESEKNPPTIWGKTPIWLCKGWKPPPADPGPGIGPWTIQQTWNQAADRGPWTRQQDDWPWTRQQMMEPGPVSIPWTPPGSGSWTLDQVANPGLGSGPSPMIMQWDDTPEPWPSVLGTSSS